MSSYSFGVTIFSRHRAMRRLVAGFTCLLIGGTFVLPVSGQTPMAQGPTVQSSPAPTGSGDAVVGPGDLLEVRVFDVPELSGSYRVSGDGKLTLPLVGELQAVGTSSSALAAQVAALYVSKGLILHPQVTIRILEFATQGITIEGEVLHPGIYPFYGPRLLVDALALAGGLTAQADTQIQVQHRSSRTEETISLPFEGKRSLAAQNTPIYPGDSIFVPRAGIVYVLGEVVRPGGIVMRNSGHLTVLEALSESQGAKRTAAMKSTFILRKQGGSYTRIELPLNGYLKKTKEDVELSGGDVLVVPSSGAKVFWQDTSAFIGTLGAASLYASAVR